MNILRFMYICFYIYVICYYDDKLWIRPKTNNRSLFCVYSCTVLWCWLRWGKPLAWRSITAQYIWRTQTPHQTLPKPWRWRVPRQIMSWRRKRRSWRRRRKMRRWSSSILARSPRWNMAGKDFSISSGTQRLGSFLVELEWVGVSRTLLAKYTVSENIFSEDFCLLYHLLLLSDALLHADALRVLHDIEWHSALLGHRKQRYYRQDPWCGLQTHASGWEVSRDKGIRGTS